MNAKQPLKVVVVGAGHRGTKYAGYCKVLPDEMKVVAVVDPNVQKRNKLLEEHELPHSAGFDSVEDFLSSNVQADAAMNTTMDKLHVPLSIPLLRAGLHLLLEKPICNNIDDLQTLHEEIKRSGKKVMVCHVLRHAQFYKEIKRRILGGEIGEVLNISAAEHFGWERMAVAYVRGKWSNLEQAGSPVLLAKCCHDIDMISWLMKDEPVSVSSVGKLSYFREENAPEGSGERCLVDCPEHIEQNCPYTARYHLENPTKYKAYAWMDIEHIKNPTEEQRRESLKTTNNFGRCIFKCNNDLYDHQSTQIQFKNGATATFNLSGLTPKETRTIHIAGTRGEIFGSMQAGYFTIRRILPNWKHEEEIVELSMKGHGYGSGDQPIVEDFVKLCTGQETSESCTTFEDSMFGHLICFAADQSVQTGQTIQL